MLIFTLKRAAGEVSFGPGEIVELPDEMARQMILAGAARSAEPVDPSVVVESQKAPKRKRSGNGANADD